ncbi:hypothetical protein HOA59_01575 [archaeon]|jgi:hypothetical protein|nr:hypothetical protein [archaeon]MBT6824105.1 hypothetical protein [archaeon]MBT7107050.1 hypothetical protein [archaeon]MBT7297662.1 hypothetical protein [archaeon]
MKTEKRELSSPKLKKLEKDLVKLERAENYLEKEKAKLMKDKEKVRVKIRKEKEILSLKNKIKIVKGRKT